MRKPLLLVMLGLLFIASSSFMSAPVAKKSETPPISPNAKLIKLPFGKAQSGQAITLFDLRNMSVKEFQKLSGKKMNFAEKIAYSFFHHKLKKGISNDGVITNKKILKISNSEQNISKGLYIVLAIIAFGWLGMGLLDNWKGSDWVISLVLYLLFYLPGLIYTLIKMKKYYN